jgi:methylmalonyl-CoA mutase N-terminal domain/subunit
MNMSSKSRKVFYGPEDGGWPGQYPFTHGIYPEMYRQRPWTMRQYAGFGSAVATNKRFHYLLNQGVTGLSVAFDLPTQMGYDSDHPMARGEIGRVGVAISSLADMELLFHSIPLDQVSTSMTINSTAAILLALYVAVAEKQGAAAAQLRGTVQNDILKEYIARGTYIYPPGPSMRLVTDLFSWCGENVPRFNTISISGYHIREAGSTAIQELAFTFANGKAYVESALKAGLNIDDFGKRLSFFFNVQQDFFEEIAKFRAARRIWARIMKEEFGAREGKAMLCRFHTQTAGASLTAQQIDNNVVRTTMEAAAAVLGGTQSLHTNSKDEALALPTEASVQLALRTQQILAYESGLISTADPLAGSYYVEAITDEIEAGTWELLSKIDELGGAVAGIEAGFQEQEIAQSAYDYQKSVDTAEKTIVGMNRFQSEEKPAISLQKIDPATETDQIKRLTKLKAERSQVDVNKALAALAAAAGNDDNIMPHVLKCVHKYVTLGEISSALQGVFGSYRPG